MAALRVPSRPDEGISHGVEGPEGELMPDLHGLGVNDFKQPLINSPLNDLENMADKPDCI